MQTGLRRGAGGFDESRLRALQDGMDFLLRPVRAGFCRYESLKDGTLTLEDVFLMNAYLDNQAFNEAEIIRMTRHGERS